MNVTESVSPFLTSTQQLFLSTTRPIYYSPHASLTSYMPDHLLAVAAPVVAYWVASGIFHALDCSGARWLDAYRIHESEEVKSRNLASRWEVLRAVLLQHVVQTAIGLWWMDVKPVGEQVNHLAATASMAPLVFSTLRGLLGEKVGVQLFATYGHYALYFIYWWAIPALKLLFGTYVFMTYPPMRSRLNGVMVLGS